MGREDEEGSKEDMAGQHKKKRTGNGCPLTTSSTQLRTGQNTTEKGDG